MCFLITIKGGKPGFIKKKFGRAVLISTLYYFMADIFLDSVMALDIRVLVDCKQMLDQLHFNFKFYMNKNINISNKIVEFVTIFFPVK